AEALANDITRVLGVPAQNLRLLRGEYSDGSPKLLLDSPFIRGEDGTPYRDFDHFIDDGYLDRDLMAAAGFTAPLKNLGSYKAAFLLLGDRDAIGSHGQNKGFVGNTFAAIDPGHSLEGRKITVHDDFSFETNSTYTFHNFTFFDDAPLSEKMAGWDRIVQARAELSALFDNYEEQFHDCDLDFRADIGRMRREVETRFAAMYEVLEPRRALYRLNEPAGRGPRLLDALDCVEKLTSDTAPTSPNGRVRLQYPRTKRRVPWDMTVRPDGSLALHPRDGKAWAPKSRGRNIVESFARTAGCGIEIDKEGFRVPATAVDAFLGAFTYYHVTAAKG
ncbi:MAG: hypothetical protein LIP77_02280, partial [Planctomycetes bacterium]|nr:hypothetical protein [Planctomycetota bacterium]